MEKDNIPLFDLPWMVSFGTKLPPKVSRIHIRDDFTSIPLKTRRVPFPLRKSVENKLNRLVENGVLEKVDPRETQIVCSTPAVNVNKGGGVVRIHGDFRVILNKALFLQLCS